jgi:hypothetical protein
LWLACALSLAVPAWLFATLLLLPGDLQMLAGLAPIVAYVAWRAWTELTEEDDAGVSRLDRAWVYVEKHLPNEGVRRVAWRTVRTVVFMGTAAAVVLGAIVLLPRPQPAAPEAPLVVQTRPVETETETPLEPRLIAGSFAMKVDSFPQMTWPAYGSMASFYGPDNPLGIDIYVGGDARVMAAARGSVAYAGPDICCGYGFSVVLEHEGGWQTTYGHLATLEAKQGERLKPGDTLGTGGAPGNAPRRVHFQVQRHGRAYNPLNVLPASQMGLPPLPAVNAICGEPVTLDANSVVNLALTSEALRHYELDGATVSALTEDAPEVEAGLVGLLSLVLQVPPTDSAEYLLYLALHKPGDRIAIECPLTVVNAADVPLSVAPEVRRAPVITPTPFGGPPTPTPLPTATPFANATPTPAPAVPADAPPAVRPALPSPTPFGAVLRMRSTPTPTRTPEPRKAPPRSTTQRSSLAQRLTPAVTPTRAPQTTFPRQYDVAGNAGEP